MMAAGPHVRCTGSYKRSGVVLNALREYLSGFQGLLQDYLLTWRLDGGCAARPNLPGRAIPRAVTFGAIFFALRAFRRLLRTNPSPCRTTSASRRQPDETFPAVRAGERFPQIWATVAPGCYVL